MSCWMWWLRQSSTSLFLRMNAANMLVCLLWKSQAKILISNRFQAFGQKWSCVSMEKSWICSKIHPFWLNPVLCVLCVWRVRHPQWWWQKLEVKLEARLCETLYRCEVDAYEIPAKRGNWTSDVCWLNLQWLLAGLSPCHPISLVKICQTAETQDRTPQEAAWQTHWQTAQSASLQPGRDSHQSVGAQRTGCWHIVLVC